MRIPALSIVAPNGTRIAQGVKRLEIRRWKPAVLPIEHLLIVENTRFLHGDGDTDAEALAVAIVRVVEAHRWRTNELATACAATHEEGFLAWTLDRVRRIDRPFPMIAKRGIYEVDVDAGLLPHITP